jgi:pimeloyl-ACP methyl ester carboxylesterase
MNKQSLIALVSAITFIVTAPSNIKAQTYELLDSYTATDIGNIAASFGIPTTIYNAEYGIDVYKVIYEMPYLGENIEVSGAMFLPSDSPDTCNLPVHTYMHGTVFKRSEAPSFLPFESVLGYLMASPGYIVLMPDYVGLGVSELMHPYVHAQSEADAGVYMMEAVATFGEELGFGLNGEIFISGYSQGGHAAMALAEELQANWSDSYTVTACAPMSGPYDISGTQVPLIFNDAVYSNPAYLAYNVLGWNSYYGNLYENLNDIFQEPYASMLPGLFDGETSGADINAELPYLLEDFVQPGIVDLILNDPEHPFMIAAIDNDVYQWVPETYMQLYYCTEDEQVFYQNALTAADWMTENGALHVTTSNGGELDHGDCAGPSILGGMLWMDQFHQECGFVGIEENLNDHSAWTLAPNPAMEGYTTLLGVESSTVWHLRDITGRIVSTGTGAQVELTGLRGVYFVQVEGRGTQRILVL